ncbi:MAG: hypothetical protein BRC51_03510 [Cyanobacteria bacterium SW_12_48_29]|nr:MAG: hypothetical protein BRC51_03510 [Cyanobacteria bacterium SW_12_48_29]
MHKTGSQIYLPKGKFFLAQYDIHGSGTFRFGHLDVITKGEFLAESQRVRASILGRLAGKIIHMLLFRVFFSVFIEPLKNGNVFIGMLTTPVRSGNGYTLCTIKNTAMSW